MKEIIYNREKVYDYAKEWAFKRNPKYYNFDNVGGDCTSFVSQCIYSGSNVMNYMKNKGWYYINGNNKSPSWSGVEFLYTFLTKNNSVGPYGEEVELDMINTGDIAQLSFNGDKFEHSLIIVKTHGVKDLNHIYIASHTYDSFDKKITEYNYKKIRFIHINGIRTF